MTYKELEDLLDAFVENEQDEDKDEFYGTDREMSEYVIDNFKLFLKEKRRKK